MPGPKRSAFGVSSQLHRKGRGSSEESDNIDVSIPDDGGMLNRLK